MAYSKKQSKPYDNPTYFINTTKLDRRAVRYYKDKGVTEIWDKDGSSVGKYPGNQLAAQCSNLKRAGYQADLNPDWQCPERP